HGLDDPMLGPLISTKQFERVEGFLTDIGDARIVTGGSRPQGLADDLGGGAFIAPTLVDGVTPGSTIAQQEVFGPVVVAMTFADDEEAAGRLRIGEEEQVVLGDGVAGRQVRTHPVEVAAGAAGDGSCRDRLIDPAEAGDLRRVGDRTAPRGPP
ncbi:aldehyde dehydrogenase family protein, partial [Mycobacterium tuberculosis]|nr:aldehyde dehydrogenase family protein [Mycobacterium tuberculosis]